MEFATATVVMKTNRSALRRSPVLEVIYTTRLYRNSNLMKTNCAVFAVYTRCNGTGQCVYTRQLCDGVDDCLNGWDESMEACGDIEGM